MQKTVDVRVLILVLIYANILLLYRVNGWQQWLLLGINTLCYARNGKLTKAWVYNLLFIVMYTSDIVFHDVALPPFIAIVIVGFRMMLPCFMIGALILSTPIHALIQGLRLWHIPETIILTFAIMLRFLPSIGSDYQLIKQTLKMRNVSVTRLHPLRYIEYIIVPLLLSASRSAQQLTVAGLTKSLGSPNRRVVYQSPRFMPVDWAICLVMSVSFICVISGG